MYDFPMVMMTVLLIAALSFIGLIHIFSDYRHFNSVIDDCRQRGYLQDKTVRINCTLEENK